MAVVSSAIALGSNLGNSVSILQGAVTELHSHPQVRATACSSVYTTAPVGPPQPDYVNACLLLETELSPEELLRLMLRVEMQFGRVRRERWGPRLLDLDLLLYGDLVLTLPELQIPHPRMHERAFVLVPLSEIASDWTDPISGKTIGQIAAGVSHEGVKRSPHALHILEQPDGLS